MELFPTTSCLQSPGQTACFLKLLPFLLVNFLYFKDYKEHLWTTTQLHQESLSPNCCELPTATVPQGERRKLRVAGAPGALRQSPLSPLPSDRITLLAL